MHVKSQLYENALIMIVHDDDYVCDGNGDVAMMMVKIVTMMVKVTMMVMIMMLITMTMFVMVA